MSIIPQFDKFDGGNDGTVKSCLNVFEPLAGTPLPPTEHLAISVSSLIDFLVGVCE